MEVLFFLCLAGILLIIACGGAMVTLDENPYASYWEIGCGALFYTGCFITLIIELLVIAAGVEAAIRGLR